MFAQEMYVSYIEATTNTSLHPTYVGIGRTYGALRLSGASPGRVRLELALSADQARRLEALFHVRRPSEPRDSVRPRFARCRQHVAAVRAQGGFPVLTR